MLERRNIRIIPFLLLLSFVCVACAVKSDHPQRLSTPTMTMTKSSENLSTPERSEQAIYITSSPEAREEHPTVDVTPTITEFSPTPLSTEDQEKPSEKEEITEDGKTSNRIYGWYPPRYGYLDASTCCQEFVTTVSGTSNGMDLTAINPLYELRAISFASGENKLALIHTLDSAATVVIGNLQLDKKMSVWIDYNQLMGDLKTKGQRIQLDWGPGNHFLLFETWNELEPGDTQIGFIDIQHNQAYQLKGKCEHLQLNSDLQVSLICPMAGGQNSFIVLSDNGTIIELSDLPKDNMLIKKWTSSIRGEKIAWVTLDGTLKINGADSPEFTLPFQVATGKRDVSMEVLQFSTDASKLLVFADSPDKNLCRGTNACWVVYDLSTLEVLWASGDGTAWPATFSPDGTKVVYFFAGYTADGLYKELCIIHNLYDHTEMIIGTQLFSALTWQE